MGDKTEALQALTATYTDSEEDEDEPKMALEPIQNDTSSVTINLTMGQVEEQQRQKAVAKLVSYYHDENDMVISEDDETDKENSINVSAEPTPSEEKQVNLASADDDVQLPSEPLGRCSQDLQDKISRLYEKMQTSGMDMNQVIQKRKDFRNPSIYEKLIQFCGINELGTNYDASTYDPLRWGKESYYEELAKAQKEEMDKRNKEPKEKTTKVEIVVGTAKKSLATVIKASGVAVSADSKKSKWDQMASTGSSGAILTTAPLTTTITGTKGTVISAFGSLPKKSKTSHS